MKLKTRRTALAWGLPLLSGLGLLVGGSSVCAASPLRIQCIGDSTTVGYTDNPVWDAQFDFGYRIGLYQRLTAAGYSVQYVGDSPEPWSGEYGQPRIIGAPDLRTLDQDHHRGYAWMTASLARDRIAEWMAQDDPDLILLMIGRIDFPYGWTSDVGAVERSLSNLVERIVVNWPEVYLIVAEIAPYTVYEETLVQYNDYIRNVLAPYYAGRGHRVSSAPLHREFLLPGGGVGAIDRSLYADGWQHANTAGNDRIARVLYDAIRARFPPAPITVIGSPAVGPDGHFHVTFAGAPNARYRIDRSTTLAGPWEIGFTNLTANTGGVFELEDPEPGPAPARFYRAAPF